MYVIRDRQYNFVCEIKPRKILTSYNLNEAIIFEKEDIAFLALKFIREFNDCYNDRNEYEVHEINFEAIDEED